MNTPIYKYDEASDTLSITFAPGEAATGIELNEQILLRINKAERRVVGVSLFNYSVLAQPTEYGRRSLPLLGLLDLSAETRDLVLDILQSEPMQSILLLSAYAPTAAESIPITSLQPLNTLLQAA